MTRAVHLRTVVIDALLAGQEICASTFAKSHDFKQESVSRVLRDLVKHLDARRAPKEPGKRRVYFRARDIAAIQRVRNERKLGTNQYSNGAVDAAATLSFDELLEAWGVRKVDLDLPRTTHIMHDEPEAAQV